MSLLFGFVLLVLCFFLLGFDFFIVGFVKFFLVIIKLLFLLDLIDLVFIKTLLLPCQLISKVFDLLSNRPYFLLYRFYGIGKVDNFIANVSNLACDFGYGLNKITNFSCYLLDLLQNAFLLSLLTFFGFFVVFDILGQFFLLVH